MPIVTEKISYLGKKHLEFITYCKHSHIELAKVFQVFEEIDKIRAQKTCNFILIRYTRERDTKHLAGYYENTILFLA